MLSQSKIQHSFHRALDSYNDQAVVQKHSAQTLLEHTIASGLSTTLERVFEFGCGTGFLTYELTERFTIKDLVANDLVEACQQYLPVSELTFIAGNVENITIPNNCDLICSASCVQWSDDLPALLNKLTSKLNNGGFLALSSFSQGQFKELTLLEQRQKMQANSQLNYWSEAMWRQQLEPGYNIKLISGEQNCVWFDSVTQLLKHLRLTGVNGNVGQTWNKQRLSEFERDYCDNFEVDGKVPLTYEPIYIVAEKKTTTV